ncbi:Gfo/Idh/MocA family oxidoreductase [Phenylobacterium sp. LjRoot219]
MTARVGLIGLGNFAQRNIIPGIVRARDVELAAIYDQSPNAVRAVAETLPPGAVCSSATELIQRRDLDLIYVATPSIAHAELVEAIIGAGRHVICEKPFATNYQEAARLASLAKTAGVVNAIDHEMRYSAIYRGIRDRVQEGYLGNVVMSALTFSSDYAVKPKYPATYYWSFGSLRDHTGGLLRQSISHFIDLYLFMFGGIQPHGGYCATMVKAKPELVESISSTGERVLSAGPLRAVDADDAIALAGRLTNGAPASITATWSAPVPTGTRWMIQGDEGMLVYEGNETGGLWGDALRGARIGKTISDLQLPQEIFPDTYPTGPKYMSALVGAEIEDVVRVIGGGSDGMFATFDSECEVWKIIEAWDK